MDIQQLKLLAGCIRTLLQQANHSLGHNQSLDLIGALPGLRKWPEVMAFLDRVAARTFTSSPTDRAGFAWYRETSPRSSSLADRP